MENYKQQWVDIWKILSKDFWQKGQNVCKLRFLIEIIDSNWRNLLKVIHIFKNANHLYSTLYSLLFLCSLNKQWPLHFLVQYEATDIKIQKVSTGCFKRPLPIKHKKVFFTNPRLAMFGSLIRPVDWSLCKIVCDVI